MKSTRAIEELLYAEQMLAQRNLPDALQVLDRAEQLGEDADRCAASRWLVWMLQGNFEAAWNESDNLRRRGAPDPHRFWLQEELNGARVIVRCLHGYGDAIQMLRYAPMLQAVASHVVFEVPPRLVDLASHLAGVNEVITWGEQAPLESPTWDVQLEVMELPYIFRSALTDLPIATSYLQPPAAAIRTASRRMGNAASFRAGLVWAGGEWNPHRSIPLIELKQLIQDSPAEFWNLQGQPAIEEARIFPELRNATEICGDGLLSLAATIANLDLVITVDTLAAHLAGAMGKEVWVLLQFAADWRWMMNRKDSPWYPTMRLFRQSLTREWSGMIQQVSQALQERIPAHQSQTLTA